MHNVLDPVLMFIKETCKKQQQQKKTDLFSININETEKLTRCEANALRRTEEAEFEFCICSSTVATSFNHCWRRFWCRHVALNIKRFILFSATFLSLCGGLAHANRSLLVLGQAVQPIVKVMCCAVQHWSSLVTMAGGRVTHSLTHSHSTHDD